MGKTLEIQIEGLKKDTQYLKKELNSLNKKVDKIIESLPTIIKEMAEQYATKDYVNKVETDINEVGGLLRGHIDEHKNLDMRVSRMERYWWLALILIGIILPIGVDYMKKLIFGE
jgi:uncharacterized coiled-coil DUF342 family protein